VGEEEEEEVLLGLGGHSGSERVPATWKRSTQQVTESPQDNC